MTTADIDCDRCVPGEGGERINVALRRCEHTMPPAAAPPLTAEMKERFACAFPPNAYIHNVTPEMQERLALALEEAALRVRQSIPAGVEMDVEDDVDQIVVGYRGETIPGLRSPLRRVFRIEW